MASPRTAQVLWTPHALLVRGGVTLRQGVSRPRRMIVLLLISLLSSFSISDATTVRESLGGSACIQEFKATRELLGQGLDSNNLYSTYLSDPARFKGSTSLLFYVANQHAVEMDPRSTLLYIGGNKHCVEGVKLLKQFSPARMVVYEPVSHYLPFLHETFANNPEVSILNFGLGAEDKDISVPDLDKGTGAYVNHTCAESRCVTLKIKKASTLLKEHIDMSGTNNFIYLNCEGCEYEVIDDLLKAGLISYFRYIHIATHAIDYPRLAFKFCATRKLLSHTHMIQYGMLFAQERWVLNP